MQLYERNGRWHFYIRYYDSKSGRRIKLRRSTGVRDDGTQRNRKAAETIARAQFADIAESLPMVNRIDGLNVEYTASDMIEGYKIFELLVLAAHGTTHLLETRK